MKLLSPATFAIAALIGAYMKEFSEELSQTTPSRYAGDAAPSTVSPRSTCRGYTGASR